MPRSPLHAQGPWQQAHDFALPIPAGAQARTRAVALLTALMMLGEITAGIFWGSMALLADGWHMGTHLAAFGIALLSYHYAAQQARQPRFTFGTAKVNALGGFASAVALAVSALFLGGESVLRLWEPAAIHYTEALGVAVLGLGVNLLSAVWLHPAADAGHPHDHAHSHDPAPHAHAHDHVMQAAYAHVLADALTSVLAIVALLAGRQLGWHWLDATMGLVGALIILRWAYGLIQETAPLLLDSAVAPEIMQQARQHLEQDGLTEVTDLHIWQIGQQRLAAITLVSHQPQAPEDYKQRLAALALHHITLEIHHCQRCQVDDPGGQSSMASP